jgi:hypothetical protein
MSIYHVIPHNDLKEHGSDSAEPCFCEPKIIFEDGHMIIVHNSLDGREAVEWANKILENDKGENDEL